MSAAQLAARRLDNTPSIYGSLARIAKQPGEPSLPDISGTLKVSPSSSAG
jgi:hypothetical protein